MSASERQLPACPTLQQTQLKSSRTSLRLKSPFEPSSCRICLSSIFDPASLTCGHRFCEDCLDRYWHIKDKPNFLICPLCRAHVYNVDFTEKEESSKHSLKEFRKNFSLMETVDTIDTSKSTMLCFKITMLIPLFYYILKWLQVLEILSLLRCKLWYKI